MRLNVLPRREVAKPVPHVAMIYKKVKNNRNMLQFHLNNKKAQYAYFSTKRYDIKLNKRGVLSDCSPRYGTHQPFSSQMPTKTCKAVRLTMIILSHMVQMHDRPNQQQVMNCWSTDSTTKDLFDLHYQCLVRSILLYNTLTIVAA